MKAKPGTPAATAFASCAPGLEHLLVRELRQLGLAPRPEAGGCSFDGAPTALYRANLFLRTANRVLLRRADFHTGHFSELEKRAAGLPWKAWLPAGVPVRVEVASYRSRLWHEGAVAERLQRAIANATGAPAADDRASGQLVLARIEANHCTISVDSSGELLHRRGYRVEVTKASLRETLAAALLLWSGWKPGQPLLDPFCGSGTIVLEAALMARGIAPGRHRTFAFEQWPDFDRAAWRGALLEADEQMRSGHSQAPLEGSDRDEGAVAIARANAERAGVADVVRFEARPLAAAQPSAPSGFIVTNPPYGERIRGGDLRNLYDALGRGLRGRFAGWRLALLGANKVLTGHTGLRFEPGPRTTNGGIPIQFLRSLDSGSGPDRMLLQEAARFDPEGGALVAIVDLARQELRLLDGERRVAAWRVSTALNGPGEREGSNCTPTGWHEVGDRMGDGERAGTVFKERIPTGLVLPREGWAWSGEGDLVLSRILWLSGLEDGHNRGGDRDSHDRYIYLHGTNHEQLLGQPASAGCVRMANADVIALFELTGGRRVLVRIG